MTAPMGETTARSLPPASQTHAVRRLAADGAARAATWGIAAETAIEIGVNSRPLAVMMATPRDVEDLAVGFVISETIVTCAEMIESVALQVLPEGIIADVAVAPGGINEHRVRPRFLEGRAGCGLCGVETLADAIREVRPVSAPAAYEPAAVQRALAALADHQPLNRETRSVHAAAWCAPDGTIRYAREDVGRHNALDKLIGARARAGAHEEPGFIVMTSRCSFELVQKTAIAGVGLLATVSAPTGLAVDLARAAGVRIFCRQGDDLVAFGDGDEG